MFTKPQKKIRRKNTYSNYIRQFKRVTNADTAYQNYNDKRIQDEKTNHKDIIIRELHNLYIYIRVRFIEFSFYTYKFLTNFF